MTSSSGGVLPEASRTSHREFLNQYYGYYRRVYDLTRRYYLFGRDVALRELTQESWASLVDIGVGTGRNLRKLHAARPSASYGGVDASDEMLAHTRERYPWAKLSHGFAEDADLTTLLGRAPERVLFSYTLSMVGDPRAAVENARRQLAPGGRIKIVDFADFSRLPGFFQRKMRDFLAEYHVRPVDASVYRELGAAVRFGPLGYYLIADLGAKR
jgi:S-adenosylmethionine-diacylgycerolhomoserine-N-methlytransferase